MQGLKGRYGEWALVTGATSGIGRALVQRLAGEGMNIITVARTRDALEAQARELEAAHKVTVRPVVADLTTPAGTAAVIAATGDVEVGVLVPCAAIESSGYFVDTPIERHRAMLQMDVISPMELVHHYGARMASRRRGAILLVSSMSGWMAQPYMAHYGAAKAYVLSLGDSLHLEMKDKGVDVSVLSPGPTDTPMAAGTGIDFASMGMAIMSPADVANAGLDALGAGADAVPGARNKMMAFMMTRMMPRALAGSMFKTMLGKALGVKPGAPAQG